MNQVRTQALEYFHMNFGV